jgi:hypothetical protein
MTEKVVPNHGNGYLYLIAVKLRDLLGSRSSLPPPIASKARGHNFYLNVFPTYTNLA